MSITINGDGSISGISVGGLPDDIVDAGTLADNAVGLAQMAGGTDGNIITYDTSGNPAVVATGSDGQILTSAGADAVPAFEAAPGGGKVLQVVNWTLTDSSAISSSSATYIAASGVEVAITPAATSSKILILFMVGNSYSLAGGTIYALYRDGVAVADIGKTYTTDSPIAWHYLHSPSVDVSTTYQIYFKSASGTTYFKNNAPGTVSLTAMEIGA